MLKTTIKDFKKYLDHIEILAKPISKEQKKSLDNILKVMLTLLVSLKKSSNLGSVTWDAIEKVLK
jgi:hypothetical protein